MGRRVIIQGGLNLPRLLLALSSEKDKSSDNDKNNPTDFAVLTRSVHIRPMHSSSQGLSRPRNISPVKRRSRKR